MKKRLSAVLTLAVLICFMFNGCSFLQETKESGNKSISLSNIPEFSNSAYVKINDNVPSFTDDEITTKSFEQYGELDSLGRCTTAYACVGTDIMPTEERSSIGSVKPTGWQTVKYDCVDGKYLYNRCHLIGYQLTGENANTKNLITGTRYLNVDGMLPFENMVADYVKETENHVLYRVNPIFEGDNLLASGVQIEAKSVEDNGDGISFNVYCYNVQPDIVIDYSTGESHEAGGYFENDSIDSQSESSKYIINTNTKKFHKESCSAIKNTPESNKEEYSGSREELISQGYEPCKKCNP